MAWTSSRASALRQDPAVSVQDRTWIVKYGAEGAGGDELYREDLRFVRENPVAEALSRAFEIAAIDDGRADFGLVGGRPQVYEINTKPSVRRGSDDHPWADRRDAQNEAWSPYLEALRGIDAERDGGRGIKARSERLSRHRGPRWLGPRSRRVP